MLLRGVQQTVRCSGALRAALGSGQTQASGTDYTLPHPLWSDKVRDVQVTHEEPSCLRDRLAHLAVKTIRFNFDVLTGYRFGALTEDKMLTRVIFLESIAGVPGFCAATLRHLTSLRRMTHDHGFIHTLLEEGENERMHLMTFLKMKDPSTFFRLMVFLSQGVFWNFFFVSYLLSPAFCHRLVGYIEEEAVKTYTHALQEIDGGSLAKWRDAPAPDIAKRYWKMHDGATIRDLILAVRADEAHHREVNHRFAGLVNDQNAENPFPPGF